MESHAGFAPATRRFAGACLAARPVRQVGGCAGFEPASPGSQPSILTAGRTSPRWLRRKDSNLCIPVPETGVCTNTNYSAIWCIRQESNLQRAGSKPAASASWATDACWSGRRALLPPPSAWRADALLNELLPVWWRRPGLHRCLGFMRPPSVLLLHSALCLAPRRGFDPRTAARQAAMIPFHYRGVVDRRLTTDDGRLTTDDGRRTTDDERMTTDALFHCKERKGFTIDDLRFTIGNIVPSPCHPVTLSHIWHRPQDPPLEPPPSQSGALSVKLGRRMAPRPGFEPGTSALTARRSPN